MDKDTGYELKKIFRVDVEELFKAFTDETILKKIWGLSDISVDARVRGEARAEMEIDNENWNFVITYKEIIPNEKLRWVVHFDRSPDEETRVTLLFKEVPTGAELILSQENFKNEKERDENREAWKSALNTLAGLIEK